MATPAIPPTTALNRIEVSITYALPGGPGLNVWHTLASGTLATDLTNIRTFYSAIASFFPSSTTIVVGSRVTQLNTDGTVEEVPATTTPLVGTASATYMPVRLALVVSWRGSIVGRSRTGRTFLGPFASNAGSSSDGTPTDTLVSGTRTAAATLLDSGSAPQVYSRKTGRVTDIISATVFDRWAGLKTRAR